MNRPKDVNSPSPWNVRIWDENYREWLGQSDPDVLTFYGFDIRGGAVTVLQNMDWDGERIIWERSTGLSDKNGVEIYEGDIVRKRIVGDDFLYCDVIFRQTAAQFQAGYFAIVPSDVEVVGNIHEDQELLFLNEHASKEMGYE